MIESTHAVRLPGKSLARNEHVWLRNAHLADSKTFPRALLAKVYAVCLPVFFHE
jgi:hypothetical protein